MTTLVSSNEAQELEVFNGTGYELKDGDMLITMSESVFNEVVDWLEINSISSVYFNPADEAIKYSDYLILSDNNSIRLYN